MNYTNLGIIISVAPHRINFRPVIWGFCIQIALGAFVIRTTAGYQLRLSELDFKSIFFFIEYNFKEIFKVY